MLRLNLLKIKFNNLIYKFLMPAFFLLFDQIILFKYQKINRKGLLLVRLDAIGDFLIWTNVASEYKLAYPDEKVILIANQYWAQLAKKFPHFDEVFEVDIIKFTNKLNYRKKILTTIYNLNVKIAIQPTFSRSSITGDSIIRASNALEKVAPKGDSNNTISFYKNIFDKFYTKIIDINIDKHESEFIRNAKFIQNTISTNYTSKIQYIPILGELNEDLKITNDYCIIFPGASSIGKQWSAENFIALINKILNIYKIKIYLCGSNLEFKKCQYILNSINSEDVFNFAGKTNLWEFVEFIRNSKFLISNDTSASHIAPLVNTPSICILGGGHFGRFHPYPNHISENPPIIVNHFMACYSCNWECNISKDFNNPWPCILNINVDLVFNNISKLI
jgi:ADP-heptose:LPS heptosyltransferase